MLWVMLIGMTAVVVLFTLLSWIDSSDKRKSMAGRHPRMTTAALVIISLVGGMVFGMGGLIIVLVLALVAFTTTVLMSLASDEESGELPER